jgi:hypothetical protein
VDLPERLAAQTQSLLAALDPEQASHARLPFDDDERRTWYYWPAERRGLPLWELDRTQTKLVHRLLATVLPPPAFARTVTIMGLDEVLDRKEDYATTRRHRDDYWLSIFGEPGGERFGLRFEGHHVSVHVTVHADEVSSTPLFLGANPAEVRDVVGTVVAPLAIEEQLGFDLVHALSVEQRSSAVIADVAPDDIVTRNAPRLDGPLPPAGVPLTALTGPAATVARALLDVYLGRFPPGARLPDPDGASFAWAGPTEPGVGHYYRISAPRLLVELDNTQDGANHVHTVVRDPAGDFGADPLADHHRDAHPGAPAGAS